MKKLAFTGLLLPFLAMRDGDREKEFLQALGLSDDVKNLINDSEKDLTEAVNAFKTGYSSLLKNQHGDDWRKEHEEALRKQYQIGTYNTVEKKVAEAFGLNPEDYKDIDKGRFEEMLKGVSSKYQAQIEEAKKAAEDWKKKVGKDAPAMEQLQTQLETANKELEELRKLKEELPTQIEAAKKEVVNGYFKKEQLRSTLDKLRSENKIIDAIDNDTIMLMVNNIADFGVNEKDGKPTIAIYEKGTTKLLKRTETANYQDIANLVVEKILTPKNWMKKSNSKQTPTITTKTEDKGRKGHYVHPNALKASK